ncbi:MAG: putative metal-binding motif-containing protein, partial [Myxococcota bacterium]
MLRLLAPLALSLVLATGCGDEDDKETGDPGVDLNDGDGDGFPFDEDCDDENAEIYPGQTELCDGIDNNCDDLVDEGVTTTFYRDADEDGFGAPLNSIEACEQPSGYITDNTDCNDIRADANPSEEEVCDEIDNDCDDAVDEDVTTTYYADNDNDGFGNPAIPTDACEQPPNTVTDNTDCNDSAAAANPGATEICDTIDNDCDSLIDDDDDSVDLTVGDIDTYYPDTDADTFGDAADPGTMFCVQPDGFVTNNNDCDDTTDQAFPGNTEICDDIDNNCNATIDDEDSSLDLSTTGVDYYADTDEDTFGDLEDLVRACDAPDGYVTDSTDCDDSRADVNPDATEVCDDDNVDEDCDESSDDDDSSVDTTTYNTFYEDTDEDTYGDPESTTSQCDVPDGYVADNTDCNDDESGINPGAQEICDTDDTDEDCDGLADNDDSSASDETKTTYYADTDEDTYGDPDGDDDFCDLPSGYVEDNTDCDDGRSDINPEGTEVCDDDDADEDCDGVADNDDDRATEGPKTTFYADPATATYGAPDTTADFCDLPETGYSTDNTDCDDARSDVNPAADEVCDAEDVDEDCDGDADNNDSSALESSKTTFYLDADADTYGDDAMSETVCDASENYIAIAGDCDDSRSDVNPGAQEVCDADDTDEDCDGDADDADADVYPASRTTFYADTDTDTYGDPDNTDDFCDLPETGYVTDNTDCDDGRSDVNPAADEVCDDANVDEDCDTLADDLDDDATAGSQTTFYVDGDSDTFGEDGADNITQCDVPDGYVLIAGDCDDDRSEINPNADEVCDDADTDENCNGVADDEDEDVYPASFNTFYADTDSDTYGDPDNTDEACDLPATGFVTDNTDCDDSRSDINPEGTEVCDPDNADEDCSGAADDADSGVDSSTFDTYFEDEDGDGFGVDDTTTNDDTQCDVPDGYAEFAGDCNDDATDTDAPNIYPG